MPPMPHFQHELRYGCRLLLRSPAFSIVTLLTIALGTGATIAIFSVVNSTLLRPLPYKEPEGLVALWWSSSVSDTIPVSLAEFLEWRERSESFSELAAYHPWEFTLTAAGEAERIRGAVITARVFDLVGGHPQRGRAFDADGPGAPDAVILSDELWKRRFGADPEILDKKLVLDGRPFTVLGVMPAGFRFPPAYPAELWKANSLGPEDFPRDMRYLVVLGRLHQSVSLASARAEMAAIAARQEEQYPKTNTGLKASVVPLHEMMVKDFRQAVLLLQIAVLLALAIACINVSILQLVRSSARRGDVAVHLALGAGRAQLFRRFLSENLVLGLCGGALGLAAAHGGVRLLTSFGPRNIYRLEQTALDGQVLAFALLIALGCGLFFGLAPAFYASRSKFAQILREADRSAVGATWVRQLFVFFQIAITLMLLVGAGLLIRSFARLSSVSPGFDTEGLLTMQITLPGSKASIAQTSAFYRELMERVENLPGVESFATSFSLPLGGGMTVDGDFEMEGKPWTPSDPERTAQIRPVSPSFFDTLGIPLVAGRRFTEHDDATSQGVAVINQEMARLFWSGDDPLGKRLQAKIDLGAELGRFENDTWEIVGVVANVRHGGLRSAVRPEIYLSTLQGPWLLMNLIVRASSNPAGLVKPIVAEVHAMDPDLPIVRVRTMDEIISASLSQPRFHTWLMSVFAAFALGLTAIGLYGVLAFSVQQRTREIGLRMALGAGKTDVLWLVVSRGMIVALAGLAAGLVGAFFVARLMEGLLFGVTSTDPATFAGVSLVLVLVALAATYLPARRAAGLDPMTTLRFE